ncbi:hypothetical protein [Rhodococcus pseudokoreensis]
MARCSLRSDVKGFFHLMTYSQHERLGCAIGNLDRAAQTLDETVV